MSMTFTKLFSSITASTIWAEPDHTRLVWITMLAMADQHGRVWASIPGLANMARVTIEKCEAALEALSSPDKYSRTKEHEGRRIEEMDGGWRLLNHAKYRAIRDEESIKQSKRDYINKRRAAERVETVEQSRTESKPVDICRANTEAEAEAEAEARKEKGAKAPSSAKPTISCPYQSIVALYHRHLPSLPRVKLMPAPRQKALRKVWDWVLSSTRSDGSRRAESADDALAWFGDYFARAAHNDFLTGKTARGAGHENWQCDLDFLLTDKGMKQVIEKTQEAA